MTRERTHGNIMLQKKINSNRAKNSRDLSTNQLIGLGSWSKPGISTFSNPKTKTTSTKRSVTMEIKIVLTTICLSGFWQISLADLKKHLSIIRIQPPYFPFL